MSASEHSIAGPLFDGRGRRHVSVAQMAAFLDHRLHFATVKDDDSLRDGCELAAELGLAAVTCRPEHVPQASKHLMGTPVSVVTGLSLNGPCGAPVRESGLAEEARALAGQGARELAIVANAARLNQHTDPGTKSNSFLHAVTTLTSLQREHEFRLRVHLDPSGLTPERLASACIAFAEAGVWMVQAGTWEGDRASYRLLAPMRAALDTWPLLKWATPVSSHHVMLMAMSVGVDRFNADDVVGLLRDAARHAQSGPLLVPLPGVDYATEPTA